MLAQLSRQALSHGHSRARLSLHSRQRQRAPRRRIFADFAQILIARARQLYAREPGGEGLQHSAHALDSTTIDLCLALFPWARFRERKGAVKLDTLLDLHGSIPVFRARHRRQGA